MYFNGNSAKREGGGIHVRAPSVAIDFNIDPIFNTGCFIQYEVNTEPFSLDPRDWKVGKAMPSTVFLLGFNFPQLASFSLYPFLPNRQQLHSSTIQPTWMVLQFMPQVLIAVNMYLSTMRPQ